MYVGLKLLLDDRDIYGLKSLLGILTLHSSSLRLLCFSFCFTLDNHSFNYIYLWSIWLRTILGLHTFTLTNILWPFYYQKQKPTTELELEKQLTLIPSFITRAHYLHNPLTFGLSYSLFTCYTVLTCAFFCTYTCMVGWILHMRENVEFVFSLRLHNLTWYYKYIHFPTNLVVPFFSRVSEPGFRSTYSFLILKAKWLLLYLKSFVSFF